MQKRKSGESFVTELTKPECKTLTKARDVLSDLAVLEETADPSLAAMCAVIGRINKDGVYTPPAEQETTT